MSANKHTGHLSTLCKPVLLWPSGHRNIYSKANRKIFCQQDETHLLGRADTRLLHQFWEVRVLGYSCITFSELIYF